MTRNKCFEMYGEIALRYFPIVIVGTFTPSIPILVAIERLQVILPYHSQAINWSSHILVR